MKSVSIIGSGFSGMAPACHASHLGHRVTAFEKNESAGGRARKSEAQAHSLQIYDLPEWPADPLFYVCCTSKTDASVAPTGMENLFILVPIASGLQDSDSKRESYFKSLIQRIEKETGDSFEDAVVYKKSYCITNFKEDYNSFEGNAYGLANTLRQTAFLKPSVKNKHIKNLFYAGQLTLPGPGVPPALIPGKIAATEANRHLRKK